MSTTPEPIRQAAREAARLSHALDTAGTQARQDLAARHELPADDMARLDTRIEELTEELAQALDHLNATIRWHLVEDGIPDQSETAARAAVAAHQAGTDLLAAWAAHQTPRIRTAADKPPPEPAPILWRWSARDTPDTGPGRGRGLLAARTVGIVTGQGAIGKTALALQVAVAAAGGDPTGAGLGDIGLAVAPGAVVYAALEDTWPVIAHRVRTTADYWQLPHALDRIHLLTADDCGHLWASPDQDRAQPGPTQAMTMLAAACQLHRPRLVVVDPALSAVLSHHSDAATVRAFLAQLSRLPGQHGAALVVAHSTKEARAGEAGHPGQISGSAAWFDAARLVVSATRPDPGPRPAKPAKLDAWQKRREWSNTVATLEATKVTYGRPGAIAGPVHVVVDGPGSGWPVGVEAVDPKQDRSRTSSTNPPKPTEAPTLPPGPEAHR